VPSARGRVFVMATSGYSYASLDSNYFTGVLRTAFARYGDVGSRIGSDFYVRVYFRYVEQGRGYIVEVLSSDDGGDRYPGQGPDYLVTADSSEDVKAYLTVFADDVCSCGQLGSPDSDDSGELSGLSLSFEEAVI